MTKCVWLINQYSSDLQHGIGGRSFYLAEELANRGYRVYLITSTSNHLLHKHKKINSSYLVESCGLFEIVWLNLPIYSGAHSKIRVLNWFLFSFKLPKLLKFIPHKPDAVLCSSPSLISFLGARKISRLSNSRLVFEVRDIWPLTLTKLGGISTRHPFIKFLQWIEDSAYQDSDRVISNLKYAYLHMSKRGLDVCKFSWIPNGYNPSEINSPDKISDRILKSLPKGKFLVGYTGTFGLANDLITLLDSARILSSNPNIYFVLVGGGNEKQHLISYARSNGLKNIIFLDYVSKKEVQSILKCFDVLVLGAKKNPLYKYGVSPNKLCDYLVAQKPIVYHIDSGQFNPVKDAECGFEIEPENPQALADAITRIFDMDPSERHKMGRNALVYATSNFDYKYLTDKLEIDLFGKS